MRIFCSGIGGIGLSAYAAQQKAMGHDVFGSDRTDSALIADLRSQGIVISLHQDGSALPDQLDLFVYSEAVPESAPERVLAKERGVTQLSYFHALGKLTDGQRLIAVCGTHGKSSTTAMAARLLMEAGRDPSVVVGTKLRELHGRNWRKGKGDWWVVEACEYRCSFHFLSPTIILLTNADGDHFDAFGTKEKYEDAFVTFLQRLPNDGIIITHGSDPDVRAIVQRSGRNIIDADAQPMIALQTPGTHMQRNAQLVLALAEHLGISQSTATRILGGFAGTWRRMEEKGTRSQNVLIIDDYAHHPVEIRATLNAISEKFTTRRIVCAFQPHTHDRTLKAWDDFSAAFTDADLVLLLPVYDARPDTESARADIDAFGAAIRLRSGIEVLQAKDLDDAKRQLVQSILQPNDVLITMGAGSITTLSDMLLA